MADGALCSLAEPMLAPRTQTLDTDQDRDLDDVPFESEKPVPAPAPVAATLPLGPAHHVPSVPSAGSLSVSHGC
jgi:hypothetical protein